MDAKSLMDGIYANSPDLRAAEERRTQNPVREGSVGDQVEDYLTLLSGEDLTELLDKVINRRGGFKDADTIVMLKESLCIWALFVERDKGR